MYICIYMHPCIHTHTRTRTFNPLDVHQTQRHSLKLGKKGRESSKRNDYIVSPRVTIKEIIITGTIVSLFFS